MPYIYLIIRCISRLVFKCRSEGWSYQLFCLVSSHYCWVNLYCPGSKRNPHEPTALGYMLLSHFLFSFSYNWMLWKEESMQRPSDNQFKSTQPGQEHKADTLSNCLFLGSNTSASDYQITQSGCISLVQVHSTLELDKKRLRWIWVSSLQSRWRSCDYNHILKEKTLIIF